MLKKGIERNTKCKKCEVMGKRQMVDQFLAHTAKEDKPMVEEVVVLKTKQGIIVVLTKNKHHTKKH